MTIYLLLAVWFLDSNYWWDLSNGATCWPLFYPTHCSTILRFLNQFSWELPDKRTINSKISGTKNKKTTKCSKKLNSSRLKNSSAKLGFSWTAKTNKSIGAMKRHMTLTIIWCIKVQVSWTGVLHSNERPKRILQNSNRQLLMMSTHWDRGALNTKNATQTKELQPILCLKGKTREFQNQLCFLYEDAQVALLKN
jgi:hypothetical protein